VEAEVGPPGQVPSLGNISLSPPWQESALLLLSPLPAPDTMLPLTYCLFLDRSHQQPCLTISIVQFSSSSADADKIVKEIESLGNGVKAVALKADIGDVAQAKKLIEDTVAKLGRLDALINNVRKGADRPLESGNCSKLSLVFVTQAGIAVYKPIAAATEQDFDRSYALNVKAPFFLTQVGLLCTRET
jgi:hypothetical protein